MTFEQRRNVGRARRWRSRLNRLVSLAAASLISAVFTTWAWKRLQNLAPQPDGNFADALAVVTAAVSLSFAVALAWKAATAEPTQEVLHSTKP